MTERICTIPGCGKPLRSRGWCQMHYCRWKKHGDPLVVQHKHDGNRLDPSQRKSCLQCGTLFGPPSGYAHSQWARRRFCSRPCKNRHMAQRQTKAPSTTRREGERWARWWAQQRRAEDRADIKTWLERRHRRQLRIDIATAPLPGPRHWMAGTCGGYGCRQPLVFIQKGRWTDGTVSYCDTCRKKRWRMNHRQRARHYGVDYAPINHFEVFEADNYRCQLCHRKTTGKYPHPRSPSLDHIIPLALGGPHLRHNVQTACLECNTKKGTRGADDQLRLALA